jgi:uncharacterized membrane protein YgcG
VPRLQYASSKTSEDPPTGAGENFFLFVFLRKIHIVCVISRRDKFLFTVQVRVCYLFTAPFCILFSLPYCTPVILSTRAKSPRHWAHFSDALMDHWGVGRASINDGCMMVLFRRGRHVQIRTGEGIVNVVNNRFLKRLQRKVMIPHFKKGNYGDGVEDGVKALCAKILAAKRGVHKRHLTPDAFETEVQMARAEMIRTLPEVEALSAGKSPAAARDEKSQVQDARNKDQRASGSTPDSLALLQARRAAKHAARHVDTASSRRDRPSFGGGISRKNQDDGGGDGGGDGGEYKYDETGSWDELKGWLYFIGAGVFLLSFRSIMANFADKKERRKCLVCGADMEVAPRSEPILDQELSKCNRAERKVGGANFERLVCRAPGCPGPRKRICRYIPGDFFSIGPTECTWCSCRAATRKIRTLYGATNTSTGKREVTMTCACCRQTIISYEIIPRTKPTQSTYRSRGGGGSSGGYGGGGSSGGYGGGLSGGGGAGSSWLLESDEVSKPPTIGADGDVTGKHNINKI